MHVSAYDKRTFEIYRQVPAEFVRGKMLLWARLCNSDEHDDLTHLTFPSLFL